MIQKLGNYDDENLLTTYVSMLEQKVDIEEAVTQLKGELFKRAQEKGTLTGKGHRLLKIGSRVFKREVRRTIGFTNEAMNILLNLGVLSQATDRVLSRKKVEKLIKEKQIPEVMVSKIFYVVKEVFIPKVLEEKEEGGEDATQE